MTIGSIHLQLRTSLTFRGQIAVNIETATTIEPH